MLYSLTYVKLKKKGKEITLVFTRLGGYGEGRLEEGDKKVHTSSYEMSTRDVTEDVVTVARTAV